MHGLTCGFQSLFLSIKTIYMPFLARKSAFPVRRGQGKGRWSRASIDPQSSLVLLLDRCVNSAIGERVGLDLLRRPRRPVVTDSSIDPSTRCRPKIIALRDHAAAARAVGRGPTPSPSALLPASGSRVSLGQTGASPACGLCPAPARSTCSAPRVADPAPALLGFEYR